MSKKGSVESFQVKITRNDRFAQMSHQEKVIEQKKKEIQAKLEQKQKNKETTYSSKDTTNSANGPKQTKSATPSRETKKPAGNFNVFSNDGSFLDQFKLLKEKKLDQKLKSFKRDSQDRPAFNNEDRSNNKSSRWSQRRRSPSPKDQTNKTRLSRFSDKPPAYEPKININTSYSNLISQTNFDVPPQMHDAIGQSLLKNVLPPPGVAFPTPAQSSAPVIVAPPILLNVPPPQVLQPQITATLLAPLPTTNVIINTSEVVTSLNPDLGVINATVELASIPPPNPIQVHNIPQPEPINTLTIPPPAPMQVQNIPPPSPIQLNEIPNPKPLDLLAIPTPADSSEKTISDHHDFIKNIPPPNKSIPPPSLPDTTITVNVTVPPPSNITCLPPPNVQSLPPPPQQNLTMQNVPPPQNLLVQTVLPPSALQNLAPPNQNAQILSAMQMQQPPPAGQELTSISVMPLQGHQLQVGIVPPPPVVSVASAIPSLMAQPVLPPPGMGLAPPHISINCPPPILPVSTVAGMQAPPPSFVTQPPPITSQMPPMNVPPPPTPSVLIQTPVLPAEGTFKDLNAVFPPGSNDYEAMASLGRMVAQCGAGIEDIVRQRKPQDPSLWFLFYKESAPYRQYQELIKQFKAEMGKKEEDYKPEDLYEPEMAIDEDDYKQEMSQESLGEMQSNKRKRKSRWGAKETSIPPPTILVQTPSALKLPQKSSPVMISKITRNDPALIQYAVNTFGSTNLTEEEWKKAEDHFKINLLYQDMLRKRHEVEKLQMAGRNKYDYDSDEEIDGGTWEHKLREKEMMATQLWANELTRQAEGKHHIGDFLPPDELKRFMEKSTAVKEGRTPNVSDYKEFKLKEDNIGFKMLQKLGWSEGQGLGSNGAGIVEPVNKATARDQNQGLGLDQADDMDNNDDEYDAYRKRMMLAYRFRPNPLNNPRRPYY